MAKRQQYRQRLQTIEPERLVFLDETWAKTNMTRQRGWAPQGERLRMPVPRSHWKTTTFVGALGVEGMFAPMVIDGAINGDLFVAYCQQILVPRLKPGQIVVLDNLSSHKRREVRCLIEGAGCELIYLPPYSPDFNPIELAFSRLKALLRKAQKREIEELWDFLGEAVDTFTAQQCQNYFRHCDYRIEPLQ